VPQMGMGMGMGQLGQQLGELLEVELLMQSAKNFEGCQ
jgi:hypothetical protein